MKFMLQRNEIDYNTKSIMCQKGYLVSDYLKFTICDAN